MAAAVFQAKKKKMVVWTIVVAVKPERENV